MTERRARSRAWTRGALLVIALLLSAFVLSRGCAADPTEHAQNSVASARVPSESQGANRSAPNTALQPLEVDNVSERVAGSASVARSAPAEVVRPAAAYFIEVLDEVSQPVRDARVVPDAAIAARFVTDAAATRGSLVLRPVEPASHASDADPFLELSESAFRFRVSAPGFTDAVLRFEPGHADPSTPHRVELARNGSLTVTVVDELERSAAEVRVELAYSGLDLIRGGDKYRAPKGTPFTARRSGDQRRHSTSIGGIGEESRECTTGLAGVCDFADVPAGVALRVYAYRGKDFVGEADGGTELAPGEHGNLRILVRGLGPARLRFVDETGAPFSEQRAGILPARTSKKFMHLRAQDAFAYTRTTDRDGRLEFKKALNGAWFAGLEPVRDAAGSETTGSIAVRIELPASPPDSVIEIVLPRARFIAGRVITSDGQRMGACLVTAGSDETAPFLGETAEDGTFRLGPLAAGEYTLTARDSHRNLVSAPVQAEAGSTNIELRLPKPLVISIRLVTRDGVAAAPVHCAIEAASGSEFVTRFDRNDDGSFAIAIPSAEPLALVVTCADGKLGTASLLERDLSASSAIEVVVERAADVVVHNSGAMPCTVDLRAASGARVAQFTLAPDATTSARVPDGMLTVATRVAGGAEQRRSAKVSSASITAIDVP